MTGAAIHRHWQRFTPAERLGRFATYLVLVAGFVWSLRTVEVIPELSLIHI